MNKHPAAKAGPLRLGLVAGEASGDLLASLLLQGVRERWPKFQSSGIGGPLMQAQGFDAQWPSELLAVHGYSWEVLKRLAGLLRIRDALGRELLQNPPDVFIGVDAPDFNLGLHKRLRAGGIKTVQFVCPSIWAWRPERVHSLRAAADHVLCLFPFEPKLLQEHGIAATFVGHPLANHIPLQPDTAAARDTLGLAHDAQVLAILPGSRSKEVDYLLPRFLQAAQRLMANQSDLQLVLPSAPAQLARVERLVAAQHMHGKLRILQGQSHLALQACDATLIASGTATLEAALFKKPMVISYAMHPLSAMLMRRKQLQAWVGLPNILLREMVVPELLQEAATPDALAEQIAQCLHDCRTQSAHWQTLQTRFTALHKDLRADTATLAANAIQTLIDA